MATRYSHYEEVDENGLTPRQEMFCQAYAKLGKQKEAAIEAGYSKRTAASTSTKLLRKESVRARVKALTRRSRARYKAEADEILEHLSYMATRDGKDFVDATGALIENINDLPDRATKAIDGIEQETFEQEMPDGTILRKRKTKLKLASKLGAVEIAMKHHGLFAPEQQQHLIGALSLEALVEKAQLGENPIERRLESEGASDG